jgi:hypothetical protein
MTAFFWLLTQIGLLVAWYTVAPGMPALLVFLPLILTGVWTVIALLVLLLGVLVLSWEI